MSLIFAAGIFSACKKSESTAPELTAEQKLNQENYKALQAKKKDYLVVPSKEQLAKEPYLKKKLILYRYDALSSKDDKWLENDFGTDKFGSSLPYSVTEKLSSKLAKSPDELGIIGLIPECKKVPVGSYGTAAADQEKCELILVDPELSAVVYRKTFAGEVEDLKYVKSTDRFVTARVDGTEVVDFLSNLPDKSDAAPAKASNKK